MIVIVVVVYSLPSLPVVQVHLLYVSLYFTVMSRRRKGLCHGQHQTTGSFSIATLEHMLYVVVGWARCECIVNTFLNDTFEIK